MKGFKLKFIIFIMTWKYIAIYNFQKPHENAYNAIPSIDSHHISSSPAHICCWVYQIVFAMWCAPKHFQVPDGMLLNCFSIVPRISEQFDMSGRVVRLLRCYVFNVHICIWNRKVDWTLRVYGLRREASEIIAEGVFTHSQL